MKNEQPAGRRLFYVSLTDEFLRGRDLKRLRKLPDGDSLALLLILLVSDTKNTDGVLCDDVGGTLEALDAATIADDHGFSEDFVTRALDVFQERGYLQMRDDGLLEFADFDSFTKSRDAVRSARYRQRKRDGERDDVTVGVTVGVTDGERDDVSDDAKYSYSYSHSHSQSKSESNNHMSSSSSVLLSHLHDVNIEGITDDFLKRTGLDDDVIEHAIDVTVCAEPKNRAAYFMSVVNDYRRRGIKSMADVLNAEHARTATTARGKADDYQKRGYTDADYDSGFFPDLHELNAQIANDAQTARGKDDTE